MIQFAKNILKAKTMFIYIRNIKWTWEILNDILSKYVIEYFSQRDKIIRTI